MLDEVCEKFGDVGSRGQTMDSSNPTYEYVTIEFERFLKI